MKYNRIYNFNAGPAVLPEPVLESLRDDMMNFKASGISVMEMSHRSKQIEGVMKDADTLLRELLKIPNDYSVLFLQGGASQQFALAPMNLITENKPVAVIQSGYWTKKAVSELKKIGPYEVVASSEKVNFVELPHCDGLSFSSDQYSYSYLCSNNTIYGTQWRTLLPFALPAGSAPVVADMSSDILSREFNMSDFGLVFAGAQKNIGPSGLTVAIIKNELLNRVSEKVPTIFQYKAHAEAQSAYNTPPVYSIFVALRVFEWLKALGGVPAIEKINEKKAHTLYSVIDEGDYFSSPILKKDRSYMNIVFRIRNGNEELESKFAKEAEAAGLSGLKGHRAIGGLRASIYNAQSLEAVEKLAEFMVSFKNKNQ